MNELSHYENVPLLAYSPLAGGILTGKYLNNSVPKNSRLSLWNRFTRYSNENSKKATLEYINLANAFNISPTQLALAFVNQQPFVTSNIIGATNLSQLEENIKSIDIKLNDEILSKIEFIHTKYPNPAP